MLFRKCDLLSPSITLYFKGDPIHPSIFSGILTIISYFTLFSFGVYYTLGFIYKTNPNIYFYTKYIEDAGIFPLNSSSLFHFIRFGNTNNNQIQNLDFESVRIIGLIHPIDNYYYNSNLTQYSHWLYGNCVDDDIKDLKDLKNIKDLINQEFPKKSACIRKYFDSETQKYYNSTDKNFQWPSLLHGCSNNNSSNYGIIIEKCRNDSLKTNCKSKSEIDKYLEHLFTILYFVDNYIEVLDYKNPISKYLYKLTNGLFSNSFTVNNLNFNPSLISNSEGVFINYIYYQNGYQFTQNEKSIHENSNNTSILVSFYFWMQNILQNYSRNYERFQDLLSDIGGLGSFVFLISIFINSFVTDFIILLDTEELVLKIDKNNFRKQNLSLKPTILKKVSEVLNPPKLKIRNNTNKDNNNLNNQQSSIFKIFIKTK